MGQGTGQTSHHTVSFRDKAKEDCCVRWLGKESGSCWVLFFSYWAVSAKASDRRPTIPESTGTLPWSSQRSKSRKLIREFTT
jgi:hypothetical protein